MSIVVRLGAFALLSCRSHAAAIVAEDAPSPTVVATDAADVADAAAEAEAAAGDACAQSQTWDVRVTVRKTWHASAKMMLPGPLEVVVPRLNLRKTLYEDCGMTGGGCGDCSKPYDPMMISCNLTPTHAEVHIGVDEVGPTYVDVLQRGDTLVAEWTEGGLVSPGQPSTTTHRTETVTHLPCSVRVRFIP